MWTIYRHYRGKHYLSLGTALHSEDLGSYQAYRALYDNELSRGWIRPLGMFHESTASGEKRFVPVASLRVLAPEDEAVALGFGYDAWSDGRARGEFISSYAANRNHLRGTGYLLELMDGTPVSALNALRLSRGRVGLARVATAPEHRGRGHASLLMRGVMELVRMEDREIRFLLFSEVSPSFYERLGFVLLPQDWQQFPPAAAMISGAAPPTECDRELMREYF